jgi:hypothetical protein
MYVLNVLTCTCRIERLAEEDITSIADDHMILKPLNFSGHVTRLLSGWCKEIPAIDVGADLEALDVSVEILNFQGNYNVEASRTFVFASLKIYLTS